MKHSGKRLDSLPPSLRAQVERAMGLLAAKLPPIPAILSDQTKAPVPAPTPVKRRNRPVARTRNHQTWTEAAYWGHLRSAIRRAFRFWKPALAALQAARVPYSGPRGGKWAYLCADCRRLYRRTGVQIDHIVPCGSLTRVDDLPGFLLRLTPESPNAFRIRCKKCHGAKTAIEREARA